MTEFAVDHSDMVATVTISFPKAKNAIETEGWSTLQAILDDLANDDGVRCVVITGEGEDFCSGAYVGPGRDRGNDSHGLLAMRRVGQCCNTLFNLPKPTIALVEGYCIFGGWMIAAAMDLVFASTEALFLPSQLEYFSLPWDLHPRKAKELLFEYRFVDAAEAKEIGPARFIAHRLSWKRTFARLFTIRAQPRNPPETLDFRRLWDDCGSRPSIRRG